MRGAHAAGALDEHDRADRQAARDLGREVGDGERRGSSASAAIGGAIARGQPTVRRAHDVRVLAGRVAEHVGVGRRVVVGIERLHRLARDHRDAACRAARSRARAVTHVLPMSVPVPAIDDDRHRRSGHVDVDVAEHFGERGDEPVDLLVGVRGAQRDAQARGAGRDGRRPDRGHDEAALEQRRGRVDRDAAPRRTRTARSATGDPGGAGRRWRAAARRARRLRRERSTRTAASAAAVSAGVGAVVKM